MPLITEPPKLSIMVLGTGAGSTYTYHQEPSSSFAVLVDDQPALLMDIGQGVVWSCMKHLNQVPDTVYVSHNHADHSGDLTVMLAVESSKQRRLRVFSHPDVQVRLQKHRIHELQSTGKQVDDFASWHPCPESEEVHVSEHLSLRTIRTRHSEECYGLVLYWQGKPKLGWTADSGYDDGLYTSISEASTIIVDARAQSTAEHASFEDAAEMARRLVPQGKKVCVTGYGRQCEAPAKNNVDLEGAEVLRPGQIIQL